MKSKQNVNPVVAIILILVAVIGIFFVGKTFFTEKSGPQSEQDKCLYAKAEETHGDIKKLNAEDKAKLQKMMGGSGERALSSAWGVVQKQK